ncbi:MULTISPECIES: hypothetical protein [unclassified Peribacillus]|uniref:hypothetical protein n=1 Tax=unclassified Peribacillus TaxID=2675266 RepID=UPI00366A60EB
MPLHGYLKKLKYLRKKFTTPINLTFTDRWESLIADAEISSGNGKVFILTPTRVIAEGPPPTCRFFTFYKGNIYIAHQGLIIIVRPDGSKKDISSGLPSIGVHHNNGVILVPIKKCIFGKEQLQIPVFQMGKFGKAHSLPLVFLPIFHLGEQ